MTGQGILAITILFVVMLIMLAELQVSTRNERMLRQRGAIPARDEVYGTMRWAYPGAFVAMTVEAVLVGPLPGTHTLAGVVVFAAAKALKVWAIASLGGRWSYGVWVLPDAPLVSHGPYRLMRHPNYVAVMGELIGMALMVGAIATGPLGTVYFGYLLRRRIKAEEAALGLN